MPPAIPDGLTGLWTFDDNQVLDYSGNSNHGLSPVEAGPAAWSTGASSSFSGTYIEIPHDSSLSYSLYTVSMWIYLN